MLTKLYFLLGFALADYASNMKLGFLQLSVDESAEESILDKTKIVSILLINLAICIVCCGMLQVAIAFSKKMTAQLIILRKNYKQYQGLLKFREFKKSYNQENKK